ncbi:MAG TPA: zinc-binding dehydrogenase, partial [Xanthobacteraceae bacterium]|nr:zinc-binding dehydrogenase [Xanthobacteraceae bacterium]
ARAAIYELEKFRMKAMVLRAYNAPLEFQEVETPTPGAREALVRVFACGSGLTLHHSVTGNTPVNLPAILGHEVVGEVIALGEQAEGLAVGERVTLHGLLFCGQCRLCLTGREPLCESMGGMIGRQRNGGYAEYMTAPDRNWIKLPPGMLDRCGPTAACVVADAVATPYKVARHANLRPMETCVVYGAAGGVGIHLIQIAKLRGARVIGVDIGAGKLAAVAKEGADEGIDAQTHDVAAEIRRLTGGRGADVIADFVGTSDTLANSVAALAKGGRVVIVGLSRASEAMISTGAAPLLMAEQSILGSRAFTRVEIAECLALVASGVLRPVVNHVYPLAQANEAHALVGSGRNIGRVSLSIG